ncbi:hypothetical protein [Pseudoalteromonas sp. OOF1S-7]|uniref:hypothetical protein n=1 Tax=Pseudoalteromonas sp. OOF1S-7 TaxID=2917757 RepID=UPI001EF4B530|nr:hypothetical protein [Pseudoalteromonas sp. OOF1S-7]MCG7534047.1 hypothetical protein [Pseudoalteromonas sp. OOF1S-7]
MKPFIYVILLTLLSACSSVPHTPVVKQALPDVTYEGRGSAAGPMLVGAMGPVGIAIGFAIDEGIGKDIGSAMEKSKEQGLSEVASAIAEQYPDTVSVVLQKLAFKAQPGDDDSAFAMVELELGAVGHTVSLCLQTDPGNLSALKETSLGWQLMVKAVLADQTCVSD